MKIPNAAEVEDDELTSEDENFITIALYILAGIVSIGLTAALISVMG